MNPDDYRIEVKALAAEEGGGFLAWVPDLPGCMSDGDTPAQALARARTAAREWLDEALRLGLPIPPADPHGRG